MELNNIIFAFFLLSFGYLFSKYFLLIFTKYKFDLLVDNQFSKPQAFHKSSTYRLGGIIIFILLLVVFLYLNFYKNIFYPEYLSFCTLFFILGLTDDFKVNIAPKFRLFIMIMFLLFLAIYNQFTIERISLEYLDHLMKIDIFALFFICLCFLFIINGSNLIDGFNGLLSIHSLIVSIILFYINFVNNNYELSYFLFYLSLIILIFIKFNFPKAQMFLGDSGAYLLGALTAISTIMTNNLTPEISSFFFCILLFYLFFEVFFSFFRKIFFVGQNPLLPDKRHLHMLIYKHLLKKNKKHLISNYKTSIYINSIYTLLIIPGLIFMHNGLFCRYYFFLLLIIYIYFYRKLKTGV
tara:strand:- start:556 stop:1611 length:1056 start_codon:yes stop_codon:yes gene_type:complete